MEGSNKDEKHESQPKRLPEPKQVPTLQKHQSDTLQNRPAPVWDKTQLARLYQLYETLDVQNRISELKSKEQRMLKEEFFVPSKGSKSEGRLTPMRASSDNFDFTI